MAIVDPPAAARLRSIVALVNPKSGSVGAGALDTLRARASSAGLLVEARIVERDWASAVRAAASRAPDAIAILGGDGTARCAAQAVDGRAPPLLLLPGGTMNMLPRALYGDLAWPEVIEAVAARGVATTLHGAEADGRAFFVAAIFGTPALAQPAREAARDGRFGLAAARLRRAMARAFRVKIAARTRYKVLRRAEAVAVLAPAVSALEHARKLEIAAVSAQSLADGARLGFRALFGDWRADEATAITEAASVDLVSLRPIPATLDGEAERFDRRVRVTLRRNPVRVLRLPETL
ncbi:MAG: NAD(+)/NADH kinase [Alphaproteobacteria bacterium]|nr:NAD(+)/NADH kinase [Alphaproteobacteria bacterium]